MKMRRCPLKEDRRDADEDEEMPPKRKTVVTLMKMRRCPLKEERRDADEDEEMPPKGRLS